MRLFQQRKPTETKEWQQKLPDFVLRLEEAVYRGARSKVRDVRFPFARRFFHDEKRRLGFNSVVSPVFFIGRVFSRDSSRTRKKAVFAIAARNRLRRRGRRLDRAMRDGERVRHSRRRTPASADRRVEPGFEPRTRRGRTDFSSTHHRNPPRDDVFFANTRRSSRRRASRLPRHERDTTRYDNTRDRVH